MEKATSPDGETVQYDATGNLEPHVSCTDCLRTLLMCPAAEPNEESQWQVLTLLRIHAEGTWQAFHSVSKTDKGIEGTSKGTR